VYANVVQFHGGPFDIVMDFGARIDNESPDYHVRVTMSWQHLKVMLAVLQEQVSSYEAQIGQIPSPVAKEEDGE
jgi:hypothetical protein